MLIMMFETSKRRVTFLRLSLIFLVLQQATNYQISFNYQFLDHYNAACPPNFWYDFTREWKSKPLIFRVYSKYSYSGILSIERTHLDACNVVAAVLA